MGSRESASTFRKMSKSSGHVESRRYLHDEGIRFLGSKLKGERKRRGRYRPVLVTDHSEESSLLALAESEAVETSSGYVLSEEDLKREALKDRKARQ